MKTEKFVEKNPMSDKVERLYEAVRALLEEGKSVNTLTVSEITEKAGIGKGTAYEYFKSKEEMIAKAILYGRDNVTHKLQERIAAVSDFRDKYREILNWMEEIYRGEGSVVIFCQIARESMQLNSSFKEEIRKCGFNPEFVYETISNFVHEWNEKEIFGSGLPEDVQSCMVLSNFAAFWVYLNRNSKTEKEKIDRYKDYLYRCLMKNLTEEKY
ncbi:MAG: TetR/AcrR family transcriptional regulator [Oliverpabstia sp.]